MGLALIAHSAIVRLKIHTCGQCVYNAALGEQGAVVWFKRSDRCRFDTLLFYPYTFPMSIPMSQPLKGRTIGPRAFIFPSIYPAFGQWPASIGSWRVYYYSLNVKYRYGDSWISIVSKTYSCILNVNTNFHWDLRIRFLTMGSVQSCSIHKSWKSLQKWVLQFGSSCLSGQRNTSKMWSY